MTKLFPVCLPARGKRRCCEEGWIPWELAERAYTQYIRRVSDAPTLAEMAESGGFLASELDAYVPGWRSSLQRM